MPVIGFSINSVTADRKKQVIDRMDINSVARIKSVEEKEIELAGKQSSLQISFDFETIYTPDIATFKFAGEVIFSAKNVKDILKMWKKDGKLPDTIDIDVRNFLFKKCLTMGINLAEELQLPPPIVFPMIAPRGEDQTKYIG